LALFAGLLLAGCDGAPDDIGLGVSARPLSDVRRQEARAFNDQYAEVERLREARDRARREEKPGEAARLEKRLEKAYRELADKERAYRRAVQAEEEARGKAPAAAAVSPGPMQKQWD
jgi:SHS2 domain-containing protein